SLIVAGGGAAGLSILPIARELGCSQVLVPRTAGALSACGGQFSNVLTEFSMSKLAYTSDFPYQEVNHILSQIAGSIARFSDRLRKKGLSRFNVEYFVEARYPYQVWELEIALARSRFQGQEDLKRMLDAFHDEHERDFAVKEPEQQIECVYWRGRLTALLDAPPLKREEIRTHIKPQPRSVNRAHFSGTGGIDTPRYFGKQLSPGMVIEGPAIIDEPT